MTAVTKNWTVLKDYGTVKMKTDKDIVLAAIKQNIQAYDDIEYGSPLKEDRDILLAAVKNNWRVL